MGKLLEECHWETINSAKRKWVVLKGELLARGRLTKEFLKDQSGPSKRAYLLQYCQRIWHRNRNELLKASDNTYLNVFVITVREQAF